MLTFDADQTSLVADDSKVVRWAFTVHDKNGTDVATPVITNFSGIDLKRNTSEVGIIAPSDVSFTISNVNNTINFANLKGGTVLIEKYITSPTVVEHKIAGWLFKIKTADPGYQELKITAYDFLQDYLQGYYPNTRLPEDIFPSSRTYIGDMVCVPVPFGLAYVPLRDVFITNAGYLLLGDPARTFTIEKIRSPRSQGLKSEWDHGTFTFTQSTKADVNAVDWRVFQAIIADGNKDGVVDTHGFWGTPGGPILDPPVQFSRDDTVSITNPADVIAFVLEDMGIPSAMIDDGVGGSFATAHAVFDGYAIPLVFNGAFWYKQDRQKVLSQLLTMCHSCLDIGETIKLRVLSKTSRATITDADVLRTSDQGPGSFSYQDIVSEDLSDAGYVAYQESGEAQDEFKEILVSTGGTATIISSEVIECPFVQDSRNVKRIGTLHFQRKLGKVANVGFLAKGTLLALQPDDVITINDVTYGGSYDLLIDSVKINKDSSIQFQCTKLKQAISDWADLSPTSYVIPVDDTTHPWSPVITGPDSPGTPIPLNAVADRLRVGNGAADYILIEPADPRISLYNSGEKFRVGNLNGYLGVASNLFGLGIGESGAGKANLIYDVTNGLRLRSGTTNVVNIDNAGNITISGGISASTISIGTSPNWFRVDATGNIWAGQDTLANAQANTFAVTNAGVMNAITGYLGGSTNGWQITSGAITSLGTGKIQTAATGARAVLDSSGLAIYDATTQRAKIGADGAGWLGASGVIAWSSAGVVTIAGFTSGAADLTKTSGGNTTIVSSGATAFTAGPTGAPTFTVTQAGVLNATGVTVTGQINASSGTFSGNLLVSGTLQTSATATLGLKFSSAGIKGYDDAGANVQTIEINHAGTGWFGTSAAKAISWTAAGVVTIGGFTANASALYTGTKSAYNDANAGVHFGTDGIGIGNNIFTVSAVGALVATSATITGAITATSGTFTGTINATAGKFGTSTDYWSVGATGLTATSASTDVIINYGKTDFDNTQTGFILGYDFSASAAKFLIGNSTSYLNWDGAALTYTKGTLVETIIQMYTNVATLKTSATAGDGSANSAGMVVTYEGLFGCAANQTATIAAANANVRILADGSAYFKGTVTASMVSGSYVYGSSLMTKGSYLSVSCSAADATIYVGSTVDFAASGSASFMDSANDRDAFTYTGKTATTLTGCSGVLAHTVSASNKPLVVPAVKGMYISDAVNEMRFFGDRGDGTIEELASIGIGTYGGDSVLGYFGTEQSRRIGIIGRALNAYAVLGISDSNYGVYGLSNTSTGLRGASTSGYGVHATSTTSYAVYSQGTTYLGDNTTIVTGSFLGLGSTKGRITFTDAATDLITIADANLSITSLTDGYIPYHVSDASGLANSIIFQNATGIGIGTTAPAFKFTVQNDSAANDATYQISGLRAGADGTLGPLNIVSELHPSATAGNRFASIYAGDNTGYRNLALQAYGGNVGIGTTAIGDVLPTGFNSDSGNAKVLEVRSASSGDVGLFLARGDGTATGLQIWHDYSTGDSYFDNRYNSDTGNIRFRTKTAGTPVDALTILGSGNVGIGTTNPLGTLHISAPDDSVAPGLTIRQSNNNAYGFNFALDQDVNGSMFLNTVYNGETPINLMTFTRGQSSGVAGNVGIGTTAPIASAKLTITEADSNGSQLTLWNTRSGGNRYVLGVGDTGSSAVAPGAFFLYDVARTTTDFTIKAGNVGIGFTSPLGKCCINGGLHIGSETDPGDNNLLVDGTLHVDGVATLDGGFKSFGAETLKIWTYTHTVTNAEEVAGYYDFTITAVTLSKIRSISGCVVDGTDGYVYDPIAGHLGTKAYQRLAATSTTNVRSTFGWVVENDIISITIIEAV